MKALLVMLRQPGFDTGVTRSLSMKLVPLLAIVGTTLLSLAPYRALAAEQEGVALAIVYDTSGSMGDPVADTSGRHSPKYVIGNRALIAVVRQIEAFATNPASQGTRKIEAGLFTFQGERAREAVKFGPFNPEAFITWAKSFSKPNGNTPLGNALSTASRFVLTSPLKRKHILVITDGLNTAGPRPEQVFPGIKQEAARKQTVLSVHFVAFDIDAKQFDPLKKLDATVVGAANEAQLGSQLQLILEQKILLEDEEPPKTK